MIDLLSYGLLPDMTVKNKSAIPARIIAVYKERFSIVCEYGEIYGRLKTSVYYKNTFEEFPTIGDFVMVNYNQSGDSQIVKTLPRISFFSRRDPSPGRGEQAVAANFDYVFIIQSLNNDFNSRRLERYLTLALQSGAVPVVILTKADLAKDPGVYVRAAREATAGADVFAVSVKSGYGLDSLSEYLHPGKTAVLLGSSGVGKSSLVNTLAEEEVMNINEIRSSDDKGRHTTTHRQLIMLRNGLMIIDTPGMRELGMWDVSTGLGEAFADVEKYLGKCKFTDCRHKTEPGCAVKAAIADGKLSVKRWESYISLKKEAKYSDVKKPSQNERRNYEAIPRKHNLPLKVDYRNDPCPETFTCSVCGTYVLPDGAGSRHRNHCPTCLCSVHVDNEPGDRASLCGGIMDPIGVWVRKNGEWAIIHRCRICGVLNSNRVAADDNPTLLMSIAVKPLAEPPFPLGKLMQLFNINEDD